MVLSCYDFQQNPQYSQDACASDINDGAFFVVVAVGTDGDVTSIALTRVGVWPLKSRVLSLFCLRLPRLTWRKRRGAFDAGMGGLVQPAPAAEFHWLHSASRI